MAEPRLRLWTMSHRFQWVGLVACGMLGGCGGSEPAVEAEDAAVDAADEVASDASIDTASDTASDTGTSPGDSAPEAALDTDVEAALDTGSLDTGLLDTGSLDTGSLDTGSLDTGLLDTGSLDTGLLDTGLLDTGKVDTGPDAPSCGTLITSGDFDVYVDKSAPAGGNGTLACPFNTLGAASKFLIPLGNRMTVHVRGGSPQVVYDEPAPVVLSNRTTLTSTYPGAPSGPAAVKIVAAGACPLSSTVACAVGVNAEGRLEGVTVSVPPTSSNTHAIAVTNATGGRIVVTNVVATGATASGLVLLGPAQIGPLVRSEKNAQHGLEANFPATGSRILYLYDLASVIASPPTPTAISNSFDDNGGDGVRVTGEALLIIRATRAQGNKGEGLSLAATSSTQHELVGVVAKSSGGSGLSLGAGTVHVGACSLNAFDDNGSHGIAVRSTPSLAPRLLFDGGTASRNGDDGVYINVVPLLQHRVTGLVARGNGKAAGTTRGAGVDVESFFASLVLRSSVVLDNRVGLRFRQGSTNTLDVGTSASPGGNTFQATSGGAPAPTNNRKAGLCIEKSGATSGQPAYGDAWSSCPIVQKAGPTSSIATCFDAPDAIGVDVVYFPASTGGAPVDTGATCSLGSP